MSDKLLLIEHNKRLIDWFNERVSNDCSASEILKWSSYEPKFCVITWAAYDIGHYTFYTKSKDDHSTMQNSGVMVEAESMYFSSSKDKILYWQLPRFMVSLMRFGRLIMLFSKWLYLNASGFQ